MISEPSTKPRDGPICLLHALVISGDATAVSSLVCWLHWFYRHGLKRLFAMMVIETLGRNYFLEFMGRRFFFEEELLSISRYCEGRLRSYLIGYIAGNNNVKDQCPHFVWLSSPNF